MTLWRFPLVTWTDFAKGTKGSSPSAAIKKTSSASRSQRGIQDCKHLADAGAQRDALIRKLQGGANRGFHSSRPLFLGGFLFVVITIIAAWLAIWDLHGERIVDATEETRNLVVVLAEQTTRAIQAVDLVVQERQGMVLAAGVTEADQFRLRMGTEEVHHFLLDRLHSLPQANSIALIDDAGKIVNFSRAWPFRSSMLRTAIFTAICASITIPVPSSVFRL